MTQHYYTKKHLKVKTSFISVAVVCQDGLKATGMLMHALINHVTLKVSSKWNHPFCQSDTHQNVGPSECPSGEKGRGMKTSYNLYGTLFNKDLIHFLTTSTLFKCP